MKPEERWKRLKRMTPANRMIVFSRMDPAERDELERDKKPMKHGNNDTRTTTHLKKKGCRPGNQTRKLPAEVRAVFGAVQGIPDRQEFEA